MADFLSNLLDRSLHRLPVLKRRQPSLFEPVPSLYGSGLKDAFAAESETELSKEQEEVRERRVDCGLQMKPEWPDVAASVSPSFSPQDKKTESLRAPEFSLTASSADHAAGNNKEILSSLPISSKSLPEPGRDEKNISHRSVETMREEIILERAKPPFQTLHVEDEVTKHDHVSSGLMLNREPLLVAPSSQFANQTARSPLVREPDEKPASIKPKQQSVTQIMPATGRLNAASPHTIIAREPIIAPPTIQVTIGRIEIRATPPPEKSQARPPRPVAPKLSLEDYLKSRSGGAK